MNLLILLSMVFTPAAHASEKCTYIAEASGTYPSSEALALVDRILKSKGYERVYIDANAEYKVSVQTSYSTTTAPAKRSDLTPKGYWGKFYANIVLASTDTKSVLITDKRSTAENQVLDDPTGNRTKRETGHKLKEMVRYFPTCQKLEAGK